jgi:3-phenylpropionate/trans-cinnamate dioxygenase ferredoxin subunit
MSADGWVAACQTDEIELADVAPFKHDGRHFAIYRSPDDQYFATDGRCTHELFPLSRGFVMDDIIECPRHNGRFNYKTGKALGAPACIDLKTYPVKVENGTVYVRVE